MKEQKLQIIIITVAIIAVVATTAIAMVMINSSMEEGNETPTTKKPQTQANEVVGASIDYAISAIVEEKLEPRYESGEIKSYSIVSAKQLTNGTECDSYAAAQYQFEVELKYVKDSVSNVIFPGSEKVSTTNATETIAKTNFVFQKKTDGKEGFTIVDSYNICGEK